MILPVNRVSASWTRDHLKGRPPMLLICAYDDEERCRSIRIPEAISFRELDERKSSLSKEQELIFYCA
jgi:hypothetical protein